MIFTGIAAVFDRLGWVGMVSPSFLALVLGLIGLGVGLPSYHSLEKHLLRGLGKRFLGRPVASHSLESAVAASGR